jgi:hypothetical protein
LIAATALWAADAFAASAEGPVELLISVPDQTLAVLREGEVLGKFRVSTSKFGLGDDRGSYKTPLGEFRVCDKVGDGLAPGAVLSGRHATGEVLPPNAPGRDPIVTRILWLEGCEAANQHARARGIYIHGTAEEKRIGKPVSYGCIRMRSSDVVKVYDLTPVGSPVFIETRKLSAMTKPRLAERDARLAAERAAEKAARLAVDKAERENARAEKLLAKNVPPPVAAGASASRERKSGAAALMQGSILDFDLYQRADTIGVGGSEVQLPPDLATLTGPPVARKRAQ